jgi:hypothetical protein
MAPKREVTHLEICGKIPDSYSSIKDPDEVKPEAHDIDEIKLMSTVEIS